MAIRQPQEAARLMHLRVRQKHTGVAVWGLFQL
ncbi:hypothetical protein CCACVL1_12716 [Corchorus capsularis]|uniref:Uncharacterized protein n=1 Tax=Corchorus capsularis TaxID=210143 RepID=A0A1R3IE60_COCAP|nr:hypothetical protein CCACVL1_12716 [Corchorus capsularis]